MSDNKQHKDKSLINDSEQKVENRRKFLKGAVASTPLVLAVTSRPVWARGCSLSGQLSGNLSDAEDDEPCRGEGCTGGYWSNHEHRYHRDLPADMMFSDAFEVDAFPGKTLIQVCRKVDRHDMRLPPNCSVYGYHKVSSDDDDGHKHLKHCENMLRELGFQAVAALQNSASPIKYDLNVESVIASFKAAYEIGTYEAMEETKDAFDRLNNQHCPLD